MEEFIERKMSNRVYDSEGISPTLRTFVTGSVGSGDSFRKSRKGINEDLRRQSE